MSESPSQDNTPAPCMLPACRAEFGELHAKLDRLDEAIRGNGKPGINRRIDRLEQAEIGRSRMHWIIVGAFARAGASVVLQVLQMAFGGGA